MEKDFSGKVALVTGAASGIGRAVALLYAAHGARVVVSDICENGGKDTVAKIEEKGGEAIFVKTDVTNPGECAEMVKKTVEAWGRIDVASNNAAIVGERMRIAALSLEDWHKVMDTNLNSVFYCMKYEIQAMLKRDSGGAIVNTASVLGAVGAVSFGAYVTAKHGVVGLTKNAALDYSERGIRVNAVAPSFVDTPFLGDLHSGGKEFLAQLQPAGRLGSAEEVAELILWLSSDKASYVNGAFYPIDGGYLAR